MKIPVSNPYISETDASAVYEVVKKGWISMGKQVQRFEANFSEYVGCEKAIAVNNGTAALHLAVIAAGIEEGDEILIPDITFFSTVSAVMYEKAVPILVDCDPKTYNICLRDAEDKLSNKTKAIIPVDMNGLSVDYEKILNFASTHDLKIIADSAEALGAEYRDTRVGSQAPIHIFSFFPNKNITTGEGGMITLNNEGIDHYAKIKQLRTMGQNERYHHVSLGYNYRMTDIAATLGISQLNKIDTILEKKEKVVRRYNKAFENSKTISLPYLPEYATRHAWYSYTISLQEGIDRDAIAAQLADEGIETRCSFPPMHLQPAIIDSLGQQVKEFDLKDSYSAWKKLINLPIWPGLPEDQQDYVIKKVNEALDLGF